MKRKYFCGDVWVAIKKMGVPVQEGVNFKAKNVEA